MPKKTRVIVFSGIAIAIAAAASFFRFITLPTGGEVTFFSMLFISLVGYWYGPAKGIIAAVVYGILQLVINPFIISFLQVLLDYIFAFGSLGLSGLLYKKKHALKLGYLLSVFGRFVFTVISGVIFFGMYAEGAGYSAFVYSVLYNGSYIGLEAVITIAVLFIPPVNKVMERVRRMAVS